MLMGSGEHVAESLEEKMSKQIFVGGLPHNTTSDQLKEWAQRQFGPHNLANAIAVSPVRFCVPLCAHAMMIPLSFRS